jgi:hypothetical protein
MQVYLDHQDKVVASVGIPERNRDTFGESIRRMREKKLTFEEAVSSREFGLMDRHGSTGSEGNCLRNWSRLHSREVLMTKTRSRTSLPADDPARRR